MAYAGYRDRRSHTSRGHRPGGRGRYGKRSNGLSRKLLLAGASVLVLVSTVAGGGFLAHRHLNTEQMDTAFCYEREDQYQVALFVDLSGSSANSATQRRNLENLARSTFEQMPANGMVSVFTMVRQSAVHISEPDFVLCKPPRNEHEQVAIDAPSTSRARIDRTYEDAQQAFSAYVDQLIADAANPSLAAHSSPLLESIQGISRYRFSASLDKLTLFSDGLNNGPSGNFCSVQGELPRFEVWAQRSNYPFIQPDEFTGVTVDFFMLEDGHPTPGNYQFCTRLELQNFWQDFFTGNGAQSVRVTPVGYGSG